MANSYIGIFAVTLGNGVLQYFAIDNGFQLWTRWKESTDPNSDWTDLVPFQQPIAAGVTSICGGQLSDGRVQLFTADVDQNTWSCWSGSSGWNEWTPF